MASEPPPPKQPQLRTTVGYDVARAISAQSTVPGVWQKIRVEKHSIIRRPGETLAVLGWSTFYKRATCNCIFRGVELLAKNPVLRESPSSIASRVTEIADAVSHPV